MSSQIVDVNIWGYYAKFLGMALSFRFDIFSDVYIKIVFDIYKFIY